MSKLAKQWLPVFRAGDYGDKGKYTPADLQQIADNYDPKFHEAPAVIGHPKDNAPAYGWVEKLKVAGDTLFAKLREDQLDEKFAQAVEAGKFKKRSIALYKDAAKGFALKHLGWLGAVPPEVKGLADAHFQDDKFGSVAEIEFAEEAEMFDEKTFMERLIAGISEKLGGKKPGENTTENPQFDEEKISRMISDAVKPIAEENAKLLKQFSEQKVALTTVAQRAAAEAAVARLKTSGRWVPAFEKMGLGEVFAELAKSESVIEFGEGDAKKKLSPLDTLVAFMEGLGKIVPAGTTYAGQGTRVPASGKRTFASSADQNSIQLNELAEKRAKDEKIEFAQALSLVASEHPELTVPGGSSAGAA